MTSATSCWAQASALFGAICPWGAFGSLAGSFGFAGAAYLAGGGHDTIVTAWDWGGLIGGVAGSVPYGLKAVIPELGGGLFGAGLGLYASGGDWDAALMGACFGMMVGGIGGRLVQPKTIRPITSPLVGWSDDLIQAVHVEPTRALKPAIEATGWTGWWRNMRVKRTAARFGYDPDKVRYVEEIGQIGSHHPLGGVRNKATAEILIDKFAFDRAFLRTHRLPNFRLVLAHEIGHQYGLPVRGSGRYQTSIIPTRDPAEFWASFFAATRIRALHSHEARALLMHAYDNYY